MTICGGLRLCISVCGGVYLSKENNEKTMRKVEQLTHAVMCGNMRWSKPMFTNIGIDTFGTLKIHTSWSKYSFYELHGIWVSCLLLVMSSGGTSLCGMKIGYLLTLHSGVSSGCFNIELIIPRVQSIRSMLHLRWKGVWHLSHLTHNVPSRSV